jgi:hypothetical protein
MVCINFKFYIFELLIATYRLESRTYLVERNFILNSTHLEWLSS